MHVALFRLSKRQMWVERLRGSGYEVKFIHEPDRISIEMDVIVVDTRVGKWKDYLRLVQGKGVPVVLLVESKAAWGEGKELSSGIDGMVTEEDEIDGLFARFKRVAGIESDPAIQNPEKPTGFQTEETEFPGMEMDAIEPLDVVSVVPLSRRITRQRLNTESSSVLSTLSVSAPPILMSQEVPKQDDDLRNVSPPADGRTKPMDKQVENMNVIGKEETDGREDAKLPNKPDPPPRSLPWISPNLPSIVAVYAAKGGVGKTLFLLHLAALLAKAGRRVCVLDLDWMNGTVASTLQLHPSQTIVDLVDRLDNRRAAKTCLFPTEMGYSIIAAPRDAGLFTMYREPLLQLFRFLKSEVDMVLIDTPVHFDWITKLTLEQTDRLLLMTTDERASMFGLVRMAPLLSALRPLPETALIWNRLTGPVPDRERDLFPWPDILQLPETSAVAQATRSAFFSTASHRQPYMVKIQHLVDHWMGVKTAGRERNWSWLARLFFK